MSRWFAETGMMGQIAAGLWVIGGALWSGVLWYIAWDIIDRIRWRRSWRDTP